MLCFYNNVWSQFQHSFILWLGGHTWTKAISSRDTLHAADTDLSVQAGCHCHYVSSLAVDGEHVGDGAVGRLREDPVAHHAIGCGGVIRVGGRDLHHGGACGEKVYSWGVDHVHQCRQQQRRPRWERKQDAKNKQATFIKTPMWQRCAFQGPSHTFFFGLKTHTA